MFEFMRGRGRSANSRPNRTRLELERLDRRDVPSSLAAPASLTVGLAAAPTAALVGQATSNGNDNGAAGEISASSTVMASPST